MDKLLDFLRSEINSQMLYESIMKFILSPHIRNGEFEGNEYIIKKMDQLNYIIFSEYRDKSDTKREINYSFSLSRDDLIKKINHYGKSVGINISKYENFENLYSLDKYYN